MFTQLNERDVETYIDNELKNLKWNDNPQDMNECNVYKQRVKTTKQKNKLKGKKPDYVLYKEKTDENSKLWYNLIAAKKDWEKSDKADAIKKIIKAYHTDEVKKVIEESSDGMDQPVW